MNIFKLTFEYSSTVDVISKMKLADSDPTKLPNVLDDVLIKKDHYLIKPKINLGRAGIFTLDTKVSELSNSKTNKYKISVNISPITIGMLLTIALLLVIAYLVAGIILGVILIGLGIGMYFILVNWIQDEVKKKLNSIK